LLAAWISVGKFSNENKANLNETGANAEELKPEFMPLKTQKSKQI